MIDNKAQLLKAHIGNQGTSECAWQSLAHERARSLQQQRVGLESHWLKAVHAGRSGMQTMRRWLVWGAGSFPALAAPGGCCGMVGDSTEAELDWGCLEGAYGVDCFARRLRRRLWSFLPAARSMRRCWAWALRMTLLGPGRLVTWRWRKTGEVRGQIAWREPEVRVVERVASMLVYSPRLRAPKHGEEVSAVLVRLVEATNVPQVSTAKGRKLRVREHVTDSGEGAEVEVPSNEINMVLQHVGVEPTQKGSRCITFLGDFVVDMD